MTETFADGPAGPNTPPADLQEGVSRYPAGSLGRLMRKPLAVFSPEMTVAQTVEKLREITRQAFITYGYVVDAEQRLVGVVTMRELLLAPLDVPLERIMLRDPFYLMPQIPVLDAMQSVVARHYPEYPVCDERQVLVGLVRGQMLFEQQAITISAQAGEMVGVDAEERLTTPWLRSLRFRHPWLQLNLLTAFVAAAVVGLFQETIDRLVILAAFLPVLAGQSGNTGCQSLAVTLRGMTLGDLRPGQTGRLVLKEAWLGGMNGLLVGLTAGLGMLIAANVQQQPKPFYLAGIVFVAMSASCLISSITGALVPLTLRKLGADPATASSIFLTTATDVVSMGLFLSLASWLV